MSTRELEGLLGRKVETKWSLVLVGGRLFARDGDGWHEYPPYPLRPETGAAGGGD